MLDLPIIQQVEHVAFGNAGAIDRAISEQHSAGGKVAAVILEPIQSEAGVIIPPAGYLMAVREICDKHHIALIFDEVQTGRGAPAQSGAARWKTLPRYILTFGKAFGGSMPITGLICRPHM